MWVFYERRGYLQNCINIGSIWLAFLIKNFWLVEKLHWVLQKDFKWCKASHKLKCSSKTIRIYSALICYFFKFIFISRMTRFWSFWKNILICATLHITWYLFVKLNVIFQPIKIFWWEKQVKLTVNWCSSVYIFWSFSKPPCLHKERNVIHRRTPS